MPRPGGPLRLAGASAGIPIDRGPLLSPKGVAQLFPEGARPTPDWCRRVIRPRVKIGRLVLFYTRDVEAWIAAHRTE